MGAAPAERVRYGPVYAGFLLNGLGYVLLGPMLPELRQIWPLPDAQAGGMLAAQFLGSSVGTVLILRERRAAVAVGTLLSVCGFAGLAALLAWCPMGTLVYVGALAALLALGAGLGQVITVMNLTLGEAADGRAARLSFGNAGWSTGAILSPMVLVAAEHRVSLPVVLGGFAGMYLALGVLLRVSDVLRATADATVAADSRRQAGISQSTVLLFTGLLFFYGGAEACLSGWISTFARRVLGAGLAVSPLCTSAFWVGVASGRLAASVALQRWREREALAAMMAGAAGASVCLLLAHGLAAVSALAFVCGAMLGPVFPALVANLLGRGATPRQAGWVLASCGFGSGAMPLLLGAVSEGTRSLREAFLLPAVCLLVLSGMVVRLRGGRVAAES